MKNKIYRDTERCNKCGGKCCAIYKSSLNGGSYPEGMVWFEDWCNDFHVKSETYGVEPLFDPLIAHQSCEEELRNELRSKGIDIYSCQYRGKKGCMILWDKRPKHCTTYRCKQWHLENENEND